MNTQLKLQEDHSGQRQFVMTMADEDAQNLDGGVDGAAQALKNHTPDVLTFEGIEQEDAGYSATFTMDFDNVSDYENKIKALLDASDVPDEAREMDVQIDEQQLVTSIIFEESFYNDDLMGWASNALIEDDIVPASTTVLTSGGTASVVYDGDEIETSTSLPRINFSLQDDRRFHNLGMDLAILGSGDFEIAMSYQVSPDNAAVQNRFITDRVQNLNAQEGVTGAVEDSGATENHDSDNAEVRQVSANFESVEAVEEGLQTLLANEQATFSATETVGEAAPDTIIEYSGSDWTCDTICDPTNIQQLDGETDYPDDWQLVDQRRGDGDFQLELNRGMPLDSMASTTHLHFDGSMEQTFEFVLTDQTTEEHEDAIAERFEPPQGSGSFRSSSQDGSTVYTTSFKAQDAQALAGQVNTYLEEKGVSDSITLRHDPLVGIWADYNLDVDLSAIWGLARGGVEESATFHVVLPTMHSGGTMSGDLTDQTVTVEDSSGTFTVAASGPTMTTVWVVLALITLLVIVFVALLIWRKRTVDHSGADSSESMKGAPYNVQGPKDTLTETQIFRSPLVPKALRTDPEDSRTTPLADWEHARIYDQARPFPDVPIPSPTEHPQLEKPHDQQDDADNISDTSSNTQGESASEDDQK
ncbi:hypothetical protein [Yaniella halotolerans]|uniref:hypothetical protein n=1 Tax=Yaniella halotolerans TaxID=225453 RepID=UPI00041CB7F7|nr:hypothetical protein [Yaniella halotolerans]